jgi:5-methylcytosine-specific restriction endonuclease McrA
MTKQELEQMTKEGWSTRKIAAHFGVSQSSIRYHLYKHDLKTSTFSYLKVEGKPDWRRCSTCKLEFPITEFQKIKNTERYRTSCKSCISNHLKEIRVNTKSSAVEYKGGKCQLCGYNKSHAALEFHHRDPKEKDFGIAKQWYRKLDDILKRELDKCDLLCSNCHREVHEQLNTTK